MWGGVTIPAATLTPDDALWKQLAAGRLAASELTNGTLSVSGTLAGAARIDWPQGEQPRWHAGVSLTNGAAHYAAGRAWGVTGVTARVDLTGGRHCWHMAPSTLRCAGAQIAGLGFDESRVQWQWLGDELLIDCAELGWCGGTARFYGLRLDPRDPELDGVLYLERLDAGRLLATIKPLQGTATGHLYGRLPLQLRHGRILLTDGFLFALPGERGNLQLREHRFIDDYLARSGLSVALRKKIAAALLDLDYSVLRFDLTAGGAPEAHLGIKIEGESAGDSSLPPVALDINVKGPLEALLNIGLQANRGK